MFDKSGAHSVSKFIRKRIFGSEFRVIKINKNANDYYMRLTNFYAQFRSVGNNLNQTVKAVNSNFNEKRAFILMSKVNKNIDEMKDICRQIEQLTADFNRKWSRE